MHRLAAILLLAIAGLLPVNGHAHADAASGEADVARAEILADAPAGERECHGGTPHAGCAGATAIISGKPVPCGGDALTRIQVHATRAPCADPKVDGPWRPPARRRA